MPRFRCRPHLGASRWPGTPGWAAQGAFGGLLPRAVGAARRGGLVERAEPPPQTAAHSWLFLSPGCLGLVTCSACFPQKWSLSQSWGLESKLQMWAGRAPPEASLLFSPCPHGVTPLRACVLTSYKDTSQIRPHSP